MKEVLKTIIADFHQMELPDLVERDLKVPVDINKIISVIGPRRAGKTYYLLQLIKKLQSEGIDRSRILYINFEDERLELQKDQYDIILESYLELYPESELGGIYIFFDEVQELDSWQKYVRRLYDTVTKHIFITGSNSRFLSKEIASSLRGRTLSFELMPLSFPEYLRFNKINKDERFSTKGKAIVNSAFQDYLHWGGYPELAFVEKEFKTQILQEYFNVMIYRDLVERFELTNVSLVKFIMKRLISSLTKEFSINKIFKEIKSSGRSISKNFLYELIDNIFMIYLMESVEKYQPSLLNREMSNKKIYMYDSGLAAATRYSIFQDRGKLLENAVFCHLRSKSENLFFLKNSFECDFLSFSHEELITAVQVTETLSSQNLEREIKGLSAAEKIFPEAEKMILCLEKLPNLSLPKNLKMLPVTDWLLA